MRAPICLSNPISTLPRAFISQALSCPQSTWPLQGVLLPSLSPAIGQAQQSRRYASFVRRPLPRPLGPKFETEAIRQRLSRYPRDQDIKAPYVILRGDDGQLSKPQPTEEVLGRMNFQTHSLIVVAMPGSPKKKSSKAVEEDDLAGEEELEEEAEEEEEEKGTTGLPWPLCRIVNKKDMYDEEMRKKKEAKKESANFKEIEVGCAIGVHDLKIRLNHLRGFLEKGRKVQVTLMKKAKKRGGREATKDEATEVLQQVEAAVAEVPGTSEYKSREGKIGGRQLKLYFQGPHKTKDQGKKKASEESKGPGGDGGLGTIYPRAFEGV